MNAIKRYQMGRVYQKSPDLSSHPRESTEADFDIVCPAEAAGEAILVAEAMSVVAHAMQATRLAPSGLFYFRCSHTRLAACLGELLGLESFMELCGIPQGKRDRYAARFCRRIHPLPGCVGGFQRHQGLTPPGV